MYPRKKIKKKCPSYDVVVGLIVNKKNNFLITKRPKNKMLGGLWELPGGEERKRRVFKKHLNKRDKRGDKY